MLKPGMQTFFCEHLEGVSRALSEKCQVIVNRKGVILQHDNIQKEDTFGGRTELT
ncbi:unnamed protein product [Larinioides sclopetarius]|uniref:Uncharacterized protein n=1 Tax=Larinioides sclopetarius TaxID=280406 RepID=A0AAV2AJQ6_9ARAC